MKRPEYNKTYT